VTRLAFFAVLAFAIVVLTLAFRIVIPWSSVIDQREVTPSARIEFAPAPAEGKAVEFLLVLLDGPITAPGWSSG